MKTDTTPTSRALPTLTRRQLAGTGTALVGVAAIGIGTQASGRSLAELVQGGATPEGVTPQAPDDGFIEPVVFASRDGHLNVTLQAMQREETSGDPLMVFSNHLPGPTLRFKPGDTVRVAFVNALPEMTNMHVHGLHVSPRDNSDNVFIHIQPGQTFGYEYQIPENHPPGVYWYHPHPHGTSAHQVGSGLAGVIIVEGGLDEVEGIAGRKERLLALQGPFLGPQSRADNLVNGQVNPKIEIRPGEVQRWRIANISANEFYNLKLVDHPLHIIANDGNPLPEVTTVDSELIGPGERIEVLIQGGDAGIYELRSLAWAPDIPSQAQDEYLLATVVVGGDPVTDQSLPTTLLPVADISKDEVAARRTVTFMESTSAPAYSIDGLGFVEDRVNTTVKLGTIEEWTVRNASGEWHPFHIHVNDFQLISVNGEAVPLQWHDTVLLPPHGEIVIRNQFLDFTGRFVYHCHVLVHEDAGMMAVIEVVE